MSTGGASIVSTDMNGTFQFSDTQIFTVNDNDNSVNFLTNNSVKGIANLENGTLGINQDEILTVNGNYVTLSGVEGSVSLTTAASSITVVENLGGLVNGLKNAEVQIVDSDVTINGADVQINNNSTLTAIVANEKLSEVNGLANGATVTTAKNISVRTEESGAFTFPNGTYSISGNDSVTFITGADSKVIAVKNFAGTLASTENNVTVNGAAIYTSNTDASITSAGAVINGVNGLVSNDSISGDLEYATVLMPGSADSISNLTINGKNYQFSGDTDGVYDCSN